MATEPCCHDQCQKEASMWFRGKQYCMDHGCEAVSRAHQNQTADDDEDGGWGF